MAGSAFKLRCTIAGHEKDIRSVVPAIYPPDSIISGSRDVTTRIWVPNDQDPGFHEGHVMTGHSNFVSCVTVLPPDDTHTEGLVITGSNDNTILAFTLHSPTPLYRLTGHTDTVCALAVGKFGTLLSGSWDKTARVWLQEKCVMTLKGHEAAVWAVALVPEGGMMLTGSADRSIKLWRAGRCEKTFTGHEDCVRGLAVLSTDDFLSCSNDASIRLWSLSGDCLRVHYGHTNFVYSIGVLPNGRDFITSGEDRCLRVWEEGECVQTIAHPTQSVWSCCVLPNGDIATGASDGMLRVFSRDPLRQASSEEQAVYEELVAGSSIPAQIGDLKTDDMPGPEALYNPGKREGQTLMIKTPRGIEAHQWNGSEGRWIKIGDVVGGSGGTQGSSGKQLYEGKEYDYVFDVELTEGQPALKLPYNSSDDPWMVAHNWLQQNELSPLFLDQVANFIVDQARGVTLGSRNPSTSDPFTGGNRYVPGSGQGSGDTATSRTDPFTGGGRYVPGSGQADVTHSQRAPANNKYFPKTSYVSFDQANTSAIMGKLREFNSQMEVGQVVTEDDLVALEAVIGGEPLSAGALAALQVLLQWPAGMVFPVLDILRLGIRRAEVSEYFCSGAQSDRFMGLLLGCLQPQSPPANQMLALRIICNTFLQPPGQKLIIESKTTIIEAARNCVANFNKNIHIATASVLINYSIAVSESDFETIALCISSISAMSNSEDPEACFRLLVCLGTLISRGSPEVKQLAQDVSIEGFIDRCKKMREPAKLSECAGFVAERLT